jgi:hypothetical protein
VPALEVGYKKFMERVHEETSDPEWNILSHPARETLERFDHAFVQWVNYLIELDWLREGGYPMRANDVSFLEWKCLVFISHWRRSKRSGAVC